MKLSIHEKFTKPKQKAIWILPVITTLCVFILISPTYLLKAQEGDTYYHDKLFDKTFIFTPKTDEIMVRFIAQATESEIYNLVSQLQLQPIHPLSYEDRFGIYQIPQWINMDVLIHELEGSNIVAGALPVMFDQEGLTRYLFPDEFTVQFKAGLEENRMLSIIASEGSKVVKKQRTPGYFTVTIPDNKTLFQAIRDFIDLPDVLFAEPSFFQFMCMLFVPDDPYYTQQWNLNNTGQITPSTSGADIKVEDAWDITQGDPMVVIVIIDTGMDLDHVDLKDNLLSRGEEDWDFSDSTGNVPEDTNGHGTKVAGVVAAALNGNGIVGVSPKCKIMPLKVGLTGELCQRNDAINYLKGYAEQHPELHFVANCSWHADGHQTGLYLAIKEAKESGITFVCASGNKNENEEQVQYPARYLETIAVGATSPCDSRVSEDAQDLCSKYAGKESHYGDKLDVMAPGFYIVSTDLENSYAKGPNFLDYFHMTSSAAPHVSGLSGLILSIDPGLTPDDIHRIISVTADKIGDIQYNIEGVYGKKSIEYGYGRINAYRALLRTKNHCYIRNSLEHQSGAKKFSGVAVAAMIIENLAKDSRFTVIAKTQSEISSDFPAPYTGYTADEMLNILQVYAGPAQGALNWVVFRREDVDDILYDITYWQCQNSFPSAVPTKGNDPQGAYQHWVAIEGTVGDITTPDSEGKYPIIGFFVDDPNEDSGYEKTFKAAQTWVDPNENYYLPINGMYEAVIEPPPISGVASIISPETFEGLDLDPKEMARKAIETLELELNKRFREAYKESIAGSPVFVDRTDGEGNDFYLVPFYKTDSERVSVVVRIKADDGQFMEAAFNDSLPMDFAVDPTEPFDPTLSLPWSPDFGVSAFHPLYTPKNVIVYPRSGKVELYWDAVVAATHYNIYRNGDIYRTWVRQPRYIDYGVVDGITYNYGVSAVSETGEESRLTKVVQTTPTRQRIRR